MAQHSQQAAVRTQSLADGPAGQALLARERGEDPRNWLARMVAEPVAAHPDDASLFEGAPGVAFAISATCSHKHQLPTVLDEHIELITRAKLASAHRRIDLDEPADKREYDLISGLTGLGVYHLLHRSSVGTLLPDVLRYLARLTEPHEDGLPGWWACGGPTGPGWSGGHGNLGMAHGIAGPLALLAISMRRGIVVDGQAEAIDRVCRWLDKYRCGSATQMWWPEAITLADHYRGEGRQRSPHRPSWCYGTPGIARAQHLAGLALADQSRQRLAEEALVSCTNDEAQLAQLSDVSLCHGWAGLLHSVWRTSRHNEQLAAAVPRLLNQLTDRLRLHQPVEDGLLTGSTGARLAQHAARTGATPVTQWDACLLLDE